MWLFLKRVRSCLFYVIGAQAAELWLSMKCLMFLLTLPCDTSVYSGLLLQNCKRVQHIFSFLRHQLFTCHPPFHSSIHPFVPYPPLIQGWLRTFSSTTVSTSSWRIPRCSLVRWDVWATSVSSQEDMHAHKRHPHQMSRTTSAGSFEDEGAATFLQTLHLISQAENSRHPTCMKPPPPSHSHHFQRRRCEFCIKHWEQHHLTRLCQWTMVLVHIIQVTK